MKKIKKSLKIIIYIIAAIITMASVYIFLTSTIKGSLPFKGFRESTGVFLEILFGIEIALLVGMKILKYKCYPVSIKKYLVECVKILREFHISIGVLALAISLLHFSISWNISKLWSSHMVTGYLTIVLIIFSTIFGFIKNKYCRKIHIGVALIAIIPFLFHIL